MKEKLTDDQVDLIVKNLVGNLQADEETVNRIVASPYLFKKIQNRISAEKTVSRPVFWRWLIPVSAVFLFSAIFFPFVLRDQSNSEIAGGKAKNQILQPESKQEISAPEQVRELADAPKINKTVIRKSSNDTRKTFIKEEKTKSVVPKILPVKRAVEAQKENVKTESKTEFYALSYLPAPESGQLVRVKVPRSMMVSLGATNNLSKNKETVNAEILIDDYGTSRAIRFISEK